MIGNIILVILALAVAPLLGGLVAGLDRKITARFQSRFGPPVMQPFYDVAKLFAKEPRAINVWQIFSAYVYLLANALTVVLLFLGSDMLLIFFTLVVGGVFLVMGALSAPSPYSQIGGQRALNDDVRRFAAVDAHCPQIVAIHRGQYGYRQQSQVALARCGGRFHHPGMPAVDGGVGHRPAGQPADHPGDGGRDVEELQVDEHPLVAPGEFVQHAEVVAAGQQLHADLVELHRIAQPVDPRQRVCAGGGVQREDQALARSQRDGTARHHGA